MEHAISARQPAHLTMGVATTLMSFGTHIQIPYS